MVDRARSLENDFEVEVGTSIDEIDSGDAGVLDVTRASRYGGVSTNCSWRWCGFSNGKHYKN
jgi:hypothetical protein